MKRNNNVKLFNSIMEGVSKSLCRSLNEKLSFEENVIGTQILELVKRDKQINAVVASASLEDWQSVIRGMVKLIKSNKVPENPKRIPNIVQLAAAIINRGIKPAQQDQLKEMDNNAVNYLADFLNDEVSALNNKGVKLQRDKQNKFVNTNECDDSANECGNCNDEKNKSVTESLKYRKNRNHKIQGGFTKFLNEHYRRQRVKALPYRR